MVMGKDLLQELNKPQQEAVKQSEGPLLIIAGAGSGKTRTITHKVAFLIQEKGVKPENILAVTFTNKAAEEMKERVATLFGKSLVFPIISTFHSFSAQLLRRHAETLGYRNNYSICDVEDQLGVYRRVYQTLNIDSEQLPLRMVQAVVSRAKNKGQYASEFKIENLDTPNNQLIAQIFESYQDLLRRSNAMDFDDLILNAVRLLVEDADLARRYSEKFQYVLVDEYQDTNVPQNDLLRALTQKYKNVTAVGDEDQSIYSFRGADISNILRFEKDFPGARIIKLEQNYRSTQVILDAASSVISRNSNRRPKKLWTETLGGELVSLFVAGDARTEARFVARRVFHMARYQLGTIGILFRTNFQSRVFEEEFRRLHIKYRLIGGKSFYNRKEVKDALAYLRLVFRPEDDIALLRIINKPSRGIGKVTLAHLQKIAKLEGINLCQVIQKSLDCHTLPARSHAAIESFQGLINDCRSDLCSPLHICFAKILERVGYREYLEKIGTEESSNRLMNLDELLTVARDSYKSGEGIQVFLDNATLYSETDEYDSSASVTLMTLHNAKGMEFSYVFLVGCEEGLFPHSRSATHQELEEERRLCYVGMTRARKRLHMSYSRTRRFFGQESQGFNQPSRFLSEIPDELLNLEMGSLSMAGSVSSSTNAEIEKSALRKVYQGKTYDSPAEVGTFLRTMKGKNEIGLKLTSGMLVKHRRYGRGRVLKVEKTGLDLKVTVRFPGIGIKKLLQSYARLVII